MSKISRMLNDLWLEISLGDYPFIQENLIAPVLRNRELVRSLREPNYSIFKFQGHNRAGTVTMTFVGYPTALRNLRRHFFYRGNTRTRLGKIPIRKCHLAEATEDSDLLTIMGHRRFLDKLPWQQGIVQPIYVQQVLDIGGPWKEVDAHIRQRKSLRKDLNRMARDYDYTYKIAKHDEEFELFWNDIYLPTINQRHGEYASSTKKEKAYQHFKSGVLMLVSRGGQVVSAKLCQPAGDTIMLMHKGVLHADRDLMEDRALLAADYFLLKWANEQGFQTCNFLGSDPFLNDGIFQYKRKWGTRVIHPPEVRNYSWTKIVRLTPAVRYLLETSAFITVDKDETLNGLILAEDPDKVPDKQCKRWYKNYTTPGIENIHIRPFCDFSN